MKICALLICFATFTPLSVSSEELTARIADPAYRLAFPGDHGAHPEFETEWWYYTGQLFEPESNAFSAEPLYGFQLTFFRRRDVRAGHAPGQLYLAHAAISDLRKGEFLHDRRMAAGSLALAGASEGFLRVWNRGWRAGMIGGEHILEFDLEKGGRHIELRLRAKAEAPPVAHGSSGYSRKGRCPSCASHYYSFPALAVSGEVIDDGARRDVGGLAWMDHEFMSAALDKSQVGWDWFSIMLKDGRRLMLYKLRSSIPGEDFYSGTIVRGAGSVRELKPAEFVIHELAKWESPASHGSYPARWRIEVPSEEIDIELSPRLAGQELAAVGEDDTSYWEGAVADTAGSAIGYVEMTGYDKPLNLRF
jgi:predicted secreted hydrolase